MNTIRLLRSCSVALAFGILAASCRQTDEPVDVLLWEGELAPVAGTASPVSGSIAMVANEHDTQIGIGVTASAGARLGWAVLSGTCVTPGERLGPTTAFPAIDVADNGDGDAQTVIRRRVANAGQYAGVVYSTANTSGQPLACADMFRID